MSMEFKDDDNVLIIHIPNSEASVEAQHKGGKDTSVGSYYMSEQQALVYKFLNDFDGDYFIDLALVIRNAKAIYEELKDKKLENAFKRKLAPQRNAIEFLEWLITNESALYKMPNPCVNDNNKYLKLDNLNQTVDAFRSLCFGELCDICIKKIGHNGYIFYMQKSPKYYDILDKTIYNWVINDD